MIRTRIVLVDDHQLVLAGLRALLTSLPGVEVVGVAHTGTEALELIGQTRPDIVLMDISMPNLNGLEATRRTVKLYPTARVIILSMHADKHYIREAMAAGAAGYVVKTASTGELQRALASVARGELWLSPSMASAVEVELPGGRKRRVRADELTSRQREILQLIAEGNPTSQIARLLEISVKTVESHRAQIMERLEIRTVAGLVRYAIRTGIAHIDA